MKIFRPAAGLLLALIVGLPSPARAATYKIKWLLGHPNLDYFEEAAEKFKKTVELESKGDISVEIITAEKEALGDAAQAKTGPEIASQVAKGEAEMGHSFTNVMAAMEPSLLAFETPYLFRGYRHVEGVFEGPVGAGLLDGLRAHGIVGLSFTYSGGANAVATTGRELRGPADLKGLKVGVFGDEVNDAWLKSLGATPVAIRHRRDSIAPLAREGKLDAVLITWRNFERAALTRDFPQVGLTGCSYLVSVTYINEKFYASLPENYRELLMRASRESGRIERAQTIELNEISKREMLAKGVRTNYLSEKAQASFVSALRPAYGTIEGVVGAALIKKIKSAPDSPTHPMIPRERQFASR